MQVISILPVEDTVLIEQAWSLDDMQAGVPLVANTVMVVRLPSVGTE